MIPKSLVIVLATLWLISSNSYAQKYQFKLMGGLSYQSSKGFSVEYDGLYFELLPTEEGSKFFMPSLEVSRQINSRFFINLNLAYGQYRIRTLAEDRKILGGSMPATKVTTHGYDFLGTSLSSSYTLIESDKFILSPLGGLVWQYGLNNETLDLPDGAPYEKRAWDALEQSKTIIRQNQLLYQLGVKLSYNRFTIIYKHQLPISNSVDSITIEGLNIPMYAKRNFKVISISYQAFSF